MRNLLVLVDGSICSRACCEQAISLAQFFKAHVDVLYLTDFHLLEMSAVADFGGSLGAQPYTGILEQVQQAEKAKSEVVQLLVSKIFQKHRYESFTFHHRRGFLSDTINEFEKSDLGIDLIIAGRYGEGSNPKDKSVGGNVGRILKNSKTPCLVVGEEFRPLKKVLLAYDGGEQSKRSVRGILRLQKFFKGEIHLVTVDTENEPQRVKDQLADVQKVFEDAGFNVKSERLKGDICRALMRYIRVNSIDLLTMGAYGHSALRYLLMGSDTQEILETIDVPTLLYHYEN